MDRSRLYIRRTGRFRPLILVALPITARRGVIAGMASTKSREVIWGGRIRAAKMNAEHARKRATEAAREADRAEACMVGPHGRLWRAGAAIANDRSMPPWRPGLA
jgi:hypothetical protein